MKTRRSLTLTLTAAASALAALALASTTPQRAGGQAATATEERPLPTTVIEIDAPEDTVFEMAIPELRIETGDRDGAAVLRNDFRLMPGYRVQDPRGYPAELGADGLALSAATSTRLGADGVILGEARRVGEGLSVELRFYWPSRSGTAPALTRIYDGPARRLRDHMHDFANAVLETVTGRRGPFGTKIAYTQRVAPGRKDVFCGDMDGERAHRVSPAAGISMLPAFGLGQVWFTRMTPTGMYITHSGARDARLITARGGIHMAPTICDDRVFFTSTRDGNSEIYSAAPDGTDVRRLTNDPAMDLSPACGPDGTLAFVSTRHGNPQVFVMSRDGTGVRRVTYRGNHNQTPTFCPDPNRRVIAFTGRDEGYDIFTLDLATQTYTRVTQGQGDNADPAFSPDCRLIAFSSTRRGAPGVYLSSPQGNGQTRVVEGAAESVRWGR